MNKERKKLKINKQTNNQTDKSTNEQINKRTNNKQINKQVNKTNQPTIKHADNQTKTNKTNKQKENQ